MSRSMTTKQSAAEVVQFTVPIAPTVLGLNGSKVHWSKRAGVKRDYQEAVWIAVRDSVPTSSPWDSVAVSYDWHSCHRLDLDNIVIRMKHALDVLTVKGLNVITDDQVVQELSARWHKVTKKADECVIISVERLER